ncbi:MAG: aminomethyl-transferring glycine dehydrogenase subunit GcvPA [Acidimicrobiales bacterium]
MAGFVPHTDGDIAEMLAFLGLSDLDELYAVVPGAIRHAGLDLPGQMSEADVVDTLGAIAQENLAAGAGAVCFAGGGAYDHEVPAVVRALAGRSEFVTAYTPYQPEVAQGVLQALFEYQTMVARLAGLEIANASLYEGAAALVEAANLAVAESKNQRVLCSEGVNPRWVEVLQTFAQGSGRVIERVALRDGVTDFSAIPDEPAGAIVVAYPNYLGALEDLDVAADAARRTGALLIVAQDPVAAALCLSPGAHGADVVVGEGQALGNPLGFGGPYLGLFSCRKSLVRRLPGRLVGETVDVDGRRAYVTTLRAREQDIRREKASSNVCTNQALMAVTTAIQLGWLGTEGLRAVALACARGTRYCRDALVAIDGVEPAVHAPVVREFALRTPLDAEVVIDRLLDEGYLAGIALREGFEKTGLEGALLVAVTERRTKTEIDGFAAAFSKAIR